MLRLVAALFAMPMLATLLFAAPAAGQDAGAQAAAILLVDMSGSMAAGDRFEPAKTALRTTVDEVSDTTVLGLRRYGGRCGDPGQLLVAAGTGNRLELHSAIDGLQAHGETPTDVALAAAVADLPDNADKRNVVLISDGQSNCREDPCAVAQRLAASEQVDFTVHGVGFHAPEAAEEELACIARVTGGTYVSADDTDSLTEAISGAVEPPNYVALGDSYSSGEGILDYYPETDTRDNQCHRSDIAYPHHLDAYLAPLELSVFAACSGARSVDFVSARRYGEPRQLEWVTPDADLITLTGGGNDVGFEPILMRCLASYSCNEIFRDEDGEDVLANTINEAFDGWASLLGLVRERSANNAVVYLLAYPRIFNPEENGCLSTPNLPIGYLPGNIVVPPPREDFGLTTAEVTWMNERIEQTNAVLHAAARRAGVHFVYETQDAFAGHEVCADTEWVNGVVLNELVLDRVKPVSSFHPNARGHLELAKVLRDLDPLSRTNPAPDPSVPDPGGDMTTSYRFWDIRWDGMQAQLEGTFDLHIDPSQSSDPQTTLLAPGGTFELTVRSESVDLGTVTADANGVIDAQVLLPATVSPGLHTLVLTGPSADGSNLFMTAPLVVEAGDANPVPEPDPEPTPDPPTRPASRIERVAGDDRITTAVAVSVRTFPDGADEVLLARADAYPDALAGGPLAAALGAPVLLTGSAFLDPRTAAEIQRLDPDRITLLGGESALSSEVADGAGTTASVRRLAGADRFGTAAAVAGELATDAARVFLVEGANPDPARGWPDAVAVSGLAAQETAPILLTHRDELPAATRAAVCAVGANVTVVGGSAAVSDTAAAQAGGCEGVRLTERLAGDNRYATSAAVAAQMATLTGAGAPLLLGFGRSSLRTSGGAPAQPGMSHRSPSRGRRSLTAM